MPLPSEKHFLLLFLLELCEMMSSNRFSRGGRRGMSSELAISVIGLEFVVKKSICLHQNEIHAMKGKLQTRWRDDWAELRVAKVICPPQSKVDAAQLTNVEGKHSLNQQAVLVALVRVWEKLPLRWNESGRMRIPPEDFDDGNCGDGFEKSSWCFLEEFYVFRAVVDLLGRILALICQSVVRGIVRERRSPTLGWSSEL